MGYNGTLLYEINIGYLLFTSRSPLSIDNLYVYPEPSNDHISASSCYQCPLCQIVITIIMDAASKKLLSKKANRHINIISRYFTLYLCRFWLSDLPHRPIPHDWVFYVNGDPGGGGGGSSNTGRVLGVTSNNGITKSKIQIGVINT